MTSPNAIPTILTVETPGQQTVNYNDGSPVEIDVGVPSQVSVQVFETGPQGQAGASTILSVLFTQSAKAGQPIYLSRANGRAGLADASSPLTGLVVGLANEDVNATFVGDVFCSGPLVLTDWTEATGSVSLSTGSNYFLDSVAGKLTTTVQTASGHVNTYIGQAVNATTLFVSPEKPITL